LFGCVIYPTSGDAFIVWLKIKVLSENKLAAIRLEKTGCVFQLINLVAPLTSLENVMMPMMLQGIPQKEARSRAIEALTNVGMEKKINKLPRTLSGGEQQRMAIVGALLTNPELVLCDEPTASLDGKSVAIVMEDLKQIAKNGKAVAVGTNDTRLRAFASRRVYVNNGMVSDQPFDETALTKNEKT
jgi:putative ABC transport system ATP-binding protein